MNYTKLQKFISYVLLFVFFLNISIHFPGIFLTTKAEDSKFYDLVSIIVDKDTYKEVKTEIDRYSSDIMGVLENTKVVILPIPKDTKSFNIASMNEALYFEGYKSLKSVDFESRLVGTILVGDIKLPYVYDKGDSSSTVLPYTDFVEKSYIYNKKKGIYEKNSKNYSKIKPEIWHSFISPNSNDKIGDLKTFFNKDHEFYKGSGKYKQDSEIINGNKYYKLKENYKPYVFYFDSFRESKAVNYNSYNAYNLYLQNKEDLKYYRYTKELAKKLKDDVLGKSNDTIEKLVTKIHSKNPTNPETQKVLDALKNKNSPEKTSPDIQARYIIEKSVKKFSEIFSKGSIGAMRKDVHNAGRYNFGKNDVNVDFIPYLVSVLDIFNDEIIKDTESDLEDYIDNYLKANKIGPVIIPTYFKVYGKDKKVSSINKPDIKIYKNFYYGRAVDKITKAEQCSFYRGSLEANSIGSGKLVEANRAYDIDLIQSDMSAINALGKNCLKGVQDGSSLMGYWGKNSPLYISSGTGYVATGSSGTLSENGQLNLKGPSYFDKAIVDLYDIKGTRQIFDDSKIPRPEMCLENNFILEKTYKIKTSERRGPQMVLKYKIPEEVNGYHKGWNCKTDVKLAGGTTDIHNEGMSYEEFIKNVKNPDYDDFDLKECDKIVVKLNGGIVAQKLGPSCKRVGSDPDCDCRKFNINSLDDEKVMVAEDGVGGDGILYLYEYNGISSEIKHDSPRPEYLKKQLEAKISSSLPVDKNRYIDFLGKDGTYKKINYPYLYRLKPDENMTIKAMEEELNKELSIKSNEIFGNSNELQNFLKTKGYKIVKVGDEIKKISYYDMLVFSLFWNNLKTASAKYSFIFENYLSDQTKGGKNYFLAKNKRQYEIAYLGASGNAQNMFIGLNPEKKLTNPYSEIIGQNQDLSGKLLGTNIGGGEGETNEDGKNDSPFKCAPADGVNIIKWIPAIMCRLKDMMPPTIKIGEGDCGSDTLFADDEDKGEKETEEEKKAREEAKKLKQEKFKDNKSTGFKNYKEDIDNIKIKEEKGNYGYNSYVPLKTSVNGFDGKALDYLDGVNVNFSIEKIEIPNSGVGVTNEIVYNKNSNIEALKDPKILHKYLTFTPLSTKTKGGVASYGFTAKDKDINVYVKSTLTIKNSIDKNKNISIKSEIQIIKIRKNNLSASFIKKTADDKFETANHYLEVSNEPSIFIFDGEKTTNEDIKKYLENKTGENLAIKLQNFSEKKISYPLEVELKNDNGKSVWTLESESSTPISIPEQTKSGDYKLIIIDSDENRIVEKIVLQAGKPEKAEVNYGANSLQKGGSTSTNFVILKDKFGNVANGGSYEINMNLDGAGVQFLDSSSENKSTKTSEGYKVFRLKTTDTHGENALNISVKDKSGKNIPIGNIGNKLKVLNEVDIEIENKKMEVGNKTYELEVELKSKNGSTLSDLNSRLYVRTNSSYIKSLQPYFLIKKGKGIIKIKTTTLAGKNINLDFQVEGVNKIISKNIDIKAGKAMKVDLVSSSKAAINDEVKIQAELKDRYGNTVYNSNRIANLEIKSEFSHILSSTNLSKRFINGIAEFKIKTTDNPGIGYYKVSTTPTLNNSFTIKDGDKEVKIEAVSENAGAIETFYTWNKGKIAKKYYNALYTTLLGADYGNITKKDYLGGALIFDKNSRALAVTALASSSVGKNNLYNILKTGNIIKTYSKGDLALNLKTNLDLGDDGISIHLYNEALRDNIGKIKYNLSDAELKVCQENINDCLAKDKTTIFGKTFSPNFKFYDEGKLELKDKDGVLYLSIDKNGKIDKKMGLDYSLDKNNQDKFLGIKIKKGSILIAYIGIDLKDGQVKDTSSLEGNTITLDIKNKNYSTDEKVNGFSIVYNDPFASKNSLNVFSKGNLYSYENFANKKGLGWSEGNKTLLSFAAGKSVGEATKEYAGFSLINLGDPVISLKKQKKKFKNSTKYKKFDPTIGDVLSNDEDVEDYRIFDYNKDGREDILLLKRDGYLKLLENKNVSSKFVDMGNVAQIYDLQNTNLLKTGDFSGYGYDDIFFVGTDGKPYLLNNNGKDFVRQDFNEELSGRIIQAETFDMDNDGKTDIVTLDDSGEINIFYGSGSSEKPQFVKNTINSDYAIKLDSQPRNDNSLIYFDGLYQIGLVGSGLGAIKEQNKSIVDGKPMSNMNTNTGSGSNVSKSLVESMIFEQVFYDKNDNTDIRNEKEQKEKDKKEITDNLDESLTNLEDSTFYNREGETKPTYGSSSSKKNSQTTFIKGEYASTVGVKVERIYKDENLGNLQSGDIINAEVKITNISGKDLKDFAYMGKIENLFTMQKNTLKLPSGAKLKNPTNNYDFLIDRLNIKSGDSITIKYKLKTRTLKYGKIRVGLFEKGEAGDDKFGDIIVQNTKQNCGQKVTIFRSIEKRIYKKYEKEPKCDETPLPDALKNLKDEDKNGVPDYLDKLNKNIEDVKDNPKSTAKDELTSEANKLAEEYFKYPDEDKDGSPDDEDDFSVDNIMSDLSNLTSNIDSGLDNLQNEINDMSCGFAGGCISMPVNRAPLAPGNDIVFMGETYGDGLNIDEGLPIFSALTFMYYGPICGPAVWPVSPLSTGCSGQGAGGRIGVDNPANFFRLSITPTLTGGVGMSACFGGPASVMGKPPFLGLEPIVSGGNCIVIAKPLSFCNSDGSDGDPTSLGTPDYYGDNGNSFGVINGNCKKEEKQAEEKILKKDYIENFINSNGEKSGAKEYEKALVDKNSMNSGNNGKPLVSIGSGDGEEISVDIDFKNGKIDYSDIEKIVKKRIKAFPEFLMDWITRQVEEIVNKLTDFPTLFIILPDFSGVYDFDLSYEKNADNWLANSGNDSKISNDALNIDGSGETVSKVNSGIREAYEFIASMPFVKIEQKPVNITIPWISKEEIDRALASRKFTIKSRKQEVQEAKNSWTANGGKDLANKVNIDVNTSALISSLEKNIEIIEEYKDIPKKINDLINVKEKYLEQILCNIESVSEIMGGRIGKNGERFKAWVELYMLIKSILKSWQLIIDLFDDYEAECKECKNERRDSMNFIFKAISMIIPEIPVIEFPKWPDIVVDLHNIRASLNIALPEFNIDMKPIILPNLPSLNLPSSPNLNANINLPSLPIIPKLEIPELPELPSLPTIELPNLPPPPKLPELFSGFEFILDIIKLILKAYCILKTLPFVPEWRAGDQIAFLTERSGYLSFDFLSKSLPKFSLPAVDSINVNTYVNLEFETDFVVELARQIAMPINNFTADFTNIFTIDNGIGDVNITGPSDININADKTGIKIDGSTDTDIKVNGYDKDLDIKIKGPQSYNNIGNLLIGLVAKNIASIPNYLKKNKNKKVSNLEFKKLVAKSLASPRVINNPRYNELKGIWDKVFAYNFEKENKIIKELEDYNKSKFESIKDIVNTELIETKKLKKEIENSIKTGKQKVAKKTSKIGKYNSYLDRYNQKALEKTKNLLTFKNTISKELKEEGKVILDRTKYLAQVPSSPGIDIPTPGEETGESKPSGTTTSNSNSCNSGNGLYSYKFKGIYIIEDKKSYRLFDYINEIDEDTQTKTIDFDKDGDEDLLYFANNTLYLKENLEEKINLEELNISEEATIEITYYLGEHEVSDLSELNGEELSNLFEILDNESVINIKRYLDKIGEYDLENLSKKDLKKFFSGFSIDETPGDVTFTPFIINSGENKFLENEKFIEAPNNVKEDFIASGIINLSFTGLQGIYNYRLEYYKLVDKFMNLNQDNSKKVIIDGIVGIDKINLEEKTEKYFRRKDIVYIENISDYKDLKINSYIFKDIKQDLINGKQVYLSNGRKLYAGVDGFTIDYKTDNDKTIKHITIPAHQNLEVQGTIIVTGINGNAYINTGNKKDYIGSQVQELKGMPLLVGTKIIGSNNSYIDLKYYDSSKFSIDFSKMESWELYDLGYATSRDYLFSIDVKNDYLYAKLNGFKDNLIGIYSNQILLSPQQKAAKNKPELINFKSIRVPVYQKRIIDITDSIYVDGNINKIKGYIDFDLKTDKNGDGNIQNDNDSSTMSNLNLNINEGKVELEVGEFDNIFKKDIGIVLEDENGNIGIAKVSLEIYPPKPSISDYYSKTIYGNVSENLEGEPISIYRYRFGSLKQLVTLENKEKVDTGSGGKFKFPVGKADGPDSLDLNNILNSMQGVGEDKGLSIRFKNKKIASINEKTGKISLNDNRYTIGVNSGDEKTNYFPEIYIKEKSLNKKIFYQILRIKPVDKIKKIVDLDESKIKGVYLKIDNPLYNSFEFPETIKDNPGALSIYKTNDPKKTSIITILKDGRIKLKNPYKLSYNNYGDYISLDLKITNIKIGKIIYNIDGNYMIK